jgi:hypothetical protein
MERPERPNNIGKRRTITAIDGERLSFVVEDEIVLPQGTDKLIYFQRFRWEEAGNVEYRLTYYMIGFKPGKKGRWVFGQYSLMLPAAELSALLAEARRRGWDGI